MVYEGFTFFNELELLELRLNELDRVVDRFVLVESTRTFQGADKPLYYLENKERFSAFGDKIIHIVVDDFPQGANPWALEAYQRNCIARGLVDCEPDDTILISDLDHIVRAEILEECKDYHGPGNISLVLWYFYYYLNYRCITNDETAASRLLKFRNFTEANAIFRSQPELIIDDAGWHFSYMGGVERIISKIEAFSHAEFNNAVFKDAALIRRLIDAGLDLFGRANYRFETVEIDESFPRYLRENLDRFAPYLRD